MTGRERFFKTMRFEQPDRPPHFESMFELEQEAFGLRFPDRTAWGGMTVAEKDRAISQCIEIYGHIIDRFQWDALMVFWPWSDPDGVRAATSAFGKSIAIGGVVGGCVWAIETITDWTEFSLLLMDDRPALHRWAEDHCRKACASVDALVEAGADFIFVPCDVGFNGGPFVSPTDFAEIVTPYLRRIMDRIKQHGCIAIYHSDGMIMPILDQILACEPHCFMSVDPMAGMDIAEVKRQTHGKMALMGNVQCSLLQDGPKEAIRKSTLYCLEQGSPGGGYVFSTSNTIFPGMPLENYEYMLEVFHEFCGRPS